MARKGPSTIQLLLRLPAQVVALAKAELANAKEEVSGKIVKIGIAVGLLVVALIILFWVIATLLTAAIAGLSTVWPVWLSALAVSGLGILVILILALTAVVFLKKAKKPLPTETIERVEGDLEAAKHVGHTAQQVMPQPGKKGNW